MLKLAEIKRYLLDWLPAGKGAYPAGLAWLLALSWWLMLSWPLRRGLRSALGGASGHHAPGPPTKPRRPKARPRASFPRLSYPSAA